MKLAKYFEDVIITKEPYKDTELVRFQVLVTLKGTARQFEVNRYLSTEEAVEYDPLQDEMVIKAFNRMDENGDIVQ